ncbi:hypothetical protein [Neptunitalea chrysea]|nr:hypothetical protein [Neptunitalea chrysea]
MFLKSWIVNYMIVIPGPSLLFLVSEFGSADVLIVTFFKDVLAIDYI